MPQKKEVIKEKKILDTLPLGCMGNKRNELKFLIPIIEPHITKDTIFVEPFCGSAIVSFNVFKKHKDIHFHINDIDKHRIKFLKNMLIEEERTKLYKIEEQILKEGAPYYYSIVRDGNDEFLKYVISKRIHAFRHGLFPTTKKIILRKITPNWIDFLNKAIITNYNYIHIFDKYIDNKDAFLYIDPPYMDSYNAGYNTYNGQDTVDSNLLIIDNTIMYIHLLDILINGKCKILFSINECALTKHLYKDFIKESYNHQYQSTHVNIENVNPESNKKKHTTVLIISNF
jgi:site-specific DNA-adenine methylase